MACKYIYEGVTYNSKEEFISKVIPTLQEKTLSKFDKLSNKSRFYQNSIKGYKDNIENFQKAIKAIKENNYKIILPDNKGRYIASVESEGVRGGTIPIAENSYTKEAKEGKFDKEYALKYLEERIEKEKNSIKSEEEKLKEAEEENYKIASKNINSNSFLHLLSRDNNWVTFFVKSIIQDSAKKGYEKVLFPNGKTVEKIEGFNKITEELERINNNIKKHKKLINDKQGENIGNDLAKIDELETEKQHFLSAQKDTLSTIIFYENTVTNILNKTYGKDNVNVITDEYGNTWNEVNLNKDSKNVIFFDSSVPSLFGVDTSNQENLEFHINTINVISKFLENVGVEQRLVPEFLSKDGNIIEGAVAAANFIKGTVDIIDDARKRPSAWNKLPEEAAHFWYRLLETNSPLKKALWESRVTANKVVDLASEYNEAYKNGPNALTEEAIGQLIAEAIKRIETKNASAADYSFFKKFLEWVNSVISMFKNTEQDPFEVAAMKILSSDMSDLMTWEEYRKLNNVVNFADVLTEPSVAPVDYTIIADIGEARASVNEGSEEWYFFSNKDGFSPKFSTKLELDNWVSANIPEHDIRQKKILQEVEDNQLFFDRLLNKSFRKKSKFLPKTLRKYYDIIDSSSINNLREWNVAGNLGEVTKKLTGEEKKQLELTNGYTTIAPTLKVLPDLLQKYGRRTTPEIIKQEIEITNKLVKKEITKEQAIELRQKLENKKKGNPIVLSETIKIDGAKKQELSILNGIREMIKLENPNLKSITAEEFAAEAHNWLETNYLLGFANETSHLSYRVSSTFMIDWLDRVYHNKISLRFNDRYHLGSSHFAKPPSAWGNLTYFYSKNPNVKFGSNPPKDAVLLHEIQNDNIEYLRERKDEKIDLEVSLNTYLLTLNNDLLENISQIESGGKRVERKDVYLASPPKQHKQLNYQLAQLADLPPSQGLSLLKQNLNEKIELYKSNESSTPETIQKKYSEAYSRKRIFQDFQKRGGIKSVLSKEDLEELSEIIKRLNSEEIMTADRYLEDENQFEPGYLSYRTLKEKKRDFSIETRVYAGKINTALEKIYGPTAPKINLEAPAKPLPKAQRRNQVVNAGTPRERTIGNASNQLNENVNFLIAFSERTILNNLSKMIEERKKDYIAALNAARAHSFNVSLAKINLEQFTTLIENYNYNNTLLKSLIDEQIKKDLKKDTNVQDKISKALETIENRDYYYEYFLNHERFVADTREEAEQAINDYYDPEVQKRIQNKKFNFLKQKALDKKAELEKNYSKVEEEVNQILEVEMNYFTPLVHHLIQKHISQYGKDFPMYFSGYQITKLTQGNNRTALIYAGKDEVGFTEQEAKEIKYQAAQQIGLIPLISNGEKVSLEEGIKILADYKKQSKQNLDRVINTIMNISDNKPIETGAIYNAMSQISGVKLIWKDKIDGLLDNAGGYLVDLTDYNYNTPILYGIENKEKPKEEIFDSSIPTKKAVEKIEKIYKPVILHRLQDGSPVIDHTLYLSQGYKYAEKFKKEFGFIPSGVITTQRMMNKNQRSFYVLRINEEVLKQKLSAEQLDIFDATVPDLVTALNQTTAEAQVITDQINRVRDEAKTVEKKINKIENKVLRSSMRDALKGLENPDEQRRLQNFTYFILEVDKVLNYYSDLLKKIKGKPINDQINLLESAKQLAENFKNISNFLKREFQFIDDRNDFKALVNSLNSNLDQIESIYARQAEIVSLELIYENLKDDEKIAFDQLNKQRENLKNKIELAISANSPVSFINTLKDRLKEVENRINKFVPSKELVSDTFKGLRGDLGWTSGNLRSILAMGDPILSSYARKLKEGFNKVRRILIPVREQAFDVLQNYEQKLGLSRNLPQSKFYEGLFNIQESASYDPATGEITKDEFYSLLSPYEEKFYSDLLEKQIKVKKLKSQAGSEIDIKNAENELNTFLDTYVERKFKKEWYDRYDLLTPEAAKARQTLIDAQQDLLKNSEDTLTDSQIMLLHELKHKLKYLGSTIDQNGNKKEDVELAIAESIQKFNKETARMSKWEITPLNREWFTSMLEKKKNQLADGLITKKQFDTWYSLNTQRKISDEFYKERQAILDVIHSIMSKLPKEQFKEDVRDLWNDILDIARPYRDEDNITDATVMSGEAVAFVKDKEDKIEELKSKLVRFSGLTMAEEQELQGLYASLESLTPDEIQRFMQLKDEQQAYKDYLSTYISPVELSTLMSAFGKLANISTWVATPYYTQVYNEKLHEYRQQVDPGFLKDINLVEEDFIANDEWYRNNHVTKIKKEVDDYGNIHYDQVDEPIYVWKDILPTNPEYIEDDAPGFAFRTRMVKPEFFNENYKLDVKGRPVPKRTIESGGTIKKSPYINEAYDVLRNESLTDDKAKAKWDMLQFLTKVHLESQAGNNIAFSNGAYHLIDPDLEGKIPKYKRLGYFLPGVVKTTYDRVLDKGVSGLKADFKLLFTNTQEDKDLTIGDISQIDLTFIPIKHSSKVKPEDQELNLLEVILRHRAAAEEYEYLESQIGEAKLVSSSLKTSNQDVSPTAIDRILKMFGADKFIKAEKQSRRSKVFDEFIRTMFYGETEHVFPDFIGSQKYSTNKIINSFLGLSSLQIMTFNYPAHIINIISGEIQNILEAHGNKYFTLKDYFRAKALYTANIGNFWDDYTKEGNKSFWGALSERFDVPQGDFINNFGKKTKFSRLRDTKSHLMMLKNMGEHETQVSVLMAMMNNYKVKLNDKLIPLYEAFENDGGVAKLKEGVKNVNGENLTNKDLDRFQDRVHGVVRQLQGAYALFDRTVAEKTLLGKLAFYMKKYFVPMAYRRFETFKYDYEEQDFKEGYYSSVINLLKDYIKLNKAMFSNFGEFNKNITELEKRNLRIFSLELSMILGLALIISLMGGDDKERDLEGKWFKTLALYIFMKSKSEAETFLPVPGAGINELTTLFRSPFAASSTVTTAGRLINDTWAAVLGKEEARFQRDYGIWEEGDLRLKADMLKLAGFNANIITPENLVKNFELRNR